MSNLALSEIKELLKQMVMHVTPDTTFYTWHQTWFTEWKWNICTDTDGRKHSGMFWFFVFFLKGKTILMSENICGWFENFGLDWWKKVANSATSTTIVKPTLCILQIQEMVFLKNTVMECDACGESPWSVLNTLQQWFSNWGPQTHRRHSLRVAKKCAINYYHMIFERT